MKTMDSAPPEFKKKKLLCIEGAPMHVPVFGFLIQEFSICLFHCQKTAFVCEF
jgi:hypothetical protein